MKATLYVLTAAIGASTIVTSAYGLKPEAFQGKLMLPQYHQASACLERPDFLTEPRTEIALNIDKLPQMGVLVARDVEYYVEGQTDAGSPIRVHGYQSFLKASNPTQILCGLSAKGVSERYSVFAPTLIDTTKAARTGNSVWQFQILANNEKLSAWNIKSPAADENDKLDKVLAKLGSKYRLYQIGHNEYELMIIQENKGITQYLSVRYDAVSSLK